jgi:zinc transporter 2
MEAQNSEHGHIIEVSGDVPAVGTSLSGSKICGEAACGFSDAKTSSRDAMERSASMRKLLMAVVLCVIFMSVEVAGGIKANSLAILTDAAHLLSGRQLHDSLMVSSELKYWVLLFPSK